MPPFKYPEALNVYQRNAKWYDGKGHLWVKNENQFAWPGYKSGSKQKTTKYGCNCANYVLDPYTQLDIDIYESDFSETKEGHEIGQPNVVEYVSDNKFLLFDRTCKGFTAKNWEEGSEIVIRDIKASEKENYFLLFDRTCKGLKANSANLNNKEYNIKRDLYRNAFALQIKDDGSVGYKYLVQDCDSEEIQYKIESEYSLSDIITDDEWHTIHVKIIPLGIRYNKNITTTAYNQKMRIMIYVMVGLL